MFKMMSLNDVYCDVPFFGLDVESCNFALAHRWQRIVPSAGITHGVTHPLRTQTPRVWWAVSVCVMPSRSDHGTQDVRRADMQRRGSVHGTQDVRRADMQRRGSVHGTQDVRRADMQRHGEGPCPRNPRCKACRRAEARGGAVFTEPKM